MWKKVDEGWTPDVIVGRKEKVISCSKRTLCRKFETGGFDYLKGDTTYDRHHKYVVITLVERLNKYIVAIKRAERKTFAVETSLNEYFEKIPNHLFKAIIFDYGKDFSNWKTISNKQDIDIFFFKSWHVISKGLKKHSNGLLRKDGLPK